MRLSIIRKTLQVLLIPVLLCWGGLAYAQQSLTGKVVDSDNLPIVGAMVVVDGGSDRISYRVSAGYLYDGSPLVNKRGAAVVYRESLSESLKSPF